MCSKIFTQTTILENRQGINRKVGDKNTPSQQEAAVSSKMRNDTGQRFTLSKDMFTSRQNYCLPLTLATSRPETGSITQSLM